MTRLIVSVRDLQEAELAANCAVDLIDVKEPSRGSLGAVDENVAVEIRQGFDESVVLSIALGELHRFGPNLSRQQTIDLSYVDGFQYAKIGLSGTQGTAWQTRLHQLFENLPIGTEPVAVAYADWQHCQAPSIDDILHFSFANDLPALLIDTFDKSRGDLLAYCSLEEIAELIMRCQCAGLKSVLAGSLGIGHLSTLTKLRCDFVAVRGSVCQKNTRGPDRLDRRSPLDPQLVNDFKRQLQESRVEPLIPHQAARF